MSFSRSTPLLALAALCGLAAGQTTTPVSLTSLGTYPNSGATHCGMSGDARHVVFSSTATDLVANDTNVREDIFVHDRANGVTTRVNLGAGGAQTTHYSRRPTISGDGRWIAYESLSSILVAGDTNGTDDIFVFDQSTGTTTRASLAYDGAESNDSSFFISISGDGGVVAFESDATNLVPGDANSDRDLFVRVVATGTTELVSVAFDGAQANSGVVSLTDNPCCLSEDGRYVVFASSSTNLVPGDTNGESDVFLRDRVAGTTERVSLAWDGSQADDISWKASVSADGSRIAFESFASNLIQSDVSLAGDVFLRDRSAATTIVVNVDGSGNQNAGGAGTPRMSRNGRWVAFRTQGALVVPDTNQEQDVYVRDLDLGTTIRASDSTLGIQGNQFSNPAYAPLSDDGQTILFETVSTNMSPGIFPLGFFAYVRELAFHAPAATYCTAKLNSLNCTPVISLSGIPALTGFDAFKVTAAGVRDQKPGIFFWGHGPNGVPFQGGWLCVQPPTIRTPVQDSGGPSPGPNCSGAYSFHFSQAYMQSQGVTAGQTIYGQCWSRDPGFAPPNNVGLTGGLWFTVVP